MCTCNVPTQHPPIQNDPGVLADSSIPLPSHKVVFRQTTCRFDTMCASPGFCPHGWPSSQSCRHITPEKTSVLAKLGSWLGGMSVIAAMVLVGNRELKRLVAVCECCMAHHKTCPRHDSGSGKGCGSHVNCFSLVGSGVRPTKRPDLPLALPRIHTPLIDRCHSLDCSCRFSVGDETIRQ